MRYRRDPDGRVLRDNDDATVSCIPDDAANTDYAAYLAWKAAGGDPGPIPPRPAPSPADVNADTLDAQLLAALAEHRIYLALGAASTALQDKAEVRLLARCVNAIIRRRLGKLDGTD